MIEDMNGVCHTVDVTAGSLYEAVALGMAAIRTDEWVNGIAQGLNPVKVRVTNVAVEYEVKLMDCTKWLDRSGGSPRGMTERKRIRSILGMDKTNGRQGYTSQIKRTSFIEQDYRKLRAKPHLLSSSLSSRTTSPIYSCCIGLSGWKLRVTITFMPGK
jgi:hypothetical protein